VAASANAAVTAVAALFLGIAGAAAVADWIAVAPRVRATRAEYVLKPATLIALIVVAVTLRPEDATQRAWFVLALSLSLAGDVFLMLPRDLFVAGLASFLLAHIAYIIGFASAGRIAAWTGVGFAVVAVALVTAARPVLRNVRANHPALFPPVVVYMTAISLMVVMAFGSAVPLAAAGALLFYSSDTLIAWDRFVRPLRWGQPAIMSTYHVGQAALVLSLLRWWT
jgi:uncharacterized membrane protein YhhN